MIKQQHLYMLLLAGEWLRNPIVPWNYFETAQETLNSFEEMLNTLNTPITIYIQLF